MINISGGFMKFAVILGFLLSFSAFAGDSYIICASLDQSGDFLDQDYVIEEYIMDSNEIKASYYDTPDDLYEIEYTVDTNEFTARIVDVHLGVVRSKIKVSLEYYEVVKISDKIGCMLTD